MATVEQLKEALVRAHNAGDTQAASLFAEEIKAQQSSGFAAKALALPKAAARGAAESLEFLGDVGDIAPPGQLAGAMYEAALTERTLPETLRAMPMAQAWRESRAGGAGPLSSALRALGSGFTRESAGDRLRGMAAAAAQPVTERTLPEAGPLMEGTLTGARWLGGAAAVPGVGPLGQSLKTAGLAALGAGTARTGAELAELGPTGGTISELAGGLLAATRGAGIPGLWRRVQDLMKREGDIPQSVREQALIDLRALATREGGDIEDVIARIEAGLERGDVGTLARLADDPGFTSLEAQARGATAGEIRRRTAMAQEQELARLREPMESYATVPEAGRNVAQVVDDAQTAAKEAVSEAWSQVPSEELVATAPVKQALGELLDEATSVMRKRFEKTFAEEITDIRELPDEVSGETLSDLRSIISQAYKAAGEADVDDRFVTRLGAAVRDTLDAAPGGELFKQARAASREYHEAFTEGPLAAARRQTQRAGTPERMGEKLTQPGTAGASSERAIAAADELVGGGAIREAVAASLRAQFRDAVTKGEGVDPTAARRWLSGHRGALGNQPAVRAELEGLQQLAAAAKLKRAGAPEATDVMTGVEVNDAILGVARIVGAKILGVTTGQPLIGANLSTAAVKKFLEQRPRAAYTRLLQDYMLNPQNYVADMRQLTQQLPPAEALSVVQRMFNRAAAAPGVLATAGAAMQE